MFSALSIQCRVTGGVSATKATTILLEYAQVVQLAATLTESTVLAVEPMLCSHKQVAYVSKVTITFQGFAQLVPKDSNGTEPLVLILVQVNQELSGMGKDVFATNLVPSGTGNPVQYPFLAVGRVLTGMASNVFVLNQEAFGMDKHVNHRIHLRYSVVKTLTGTVNNAFALNLLTLGMGKHARPTNHTLPQIPQHSVALVLTGMASPASAT